MSVSRFQSQLDSNPALAAGGRGLDEDLFSLNNAPLLGLSCGAFTSLSGSLVHRTDSFPGWFCQALGAALPGWVGGG